MCLKPRVELLGNIIKKSLFLKDKPIVDNRLMRIGFYILYSVLMRMFSGFNYRVYRELKQKERLQNNTYFACENIRRQKKG